MQILKLSLAFFSYNSFMALMALGFNPDIAAFVETWLPFRGTLTSGIFFLGFSYVDPVYLTWYQSIVNAAMLAYAIVEMT